MGLMSSVESLQLAGRFNTVERRGLLVLAREAIVTHIEQREPVINQDELTGVQMQGACFVSLHTHGPGPAQLRGCIGSLEPYRSLVDDVIDNARAAAFRDPRFPAVAMDELNYINWCIQNFKNKKSHMIRVFKWWISQHEAANCFSK